MAEEKKEESQEEKENRALEYAKKEYAVLSDRSALEELWEKFEKLYNNISTENYYEGYANLFSPETRRAVKTLENFVDEVLFATQPGFKIKGVGGEEDEKKAEVLTKTIAWQIDKINFRSKIRRFVHYLLLYGFAVAKVNWVVKEKEMLKYNTKDKTLSPRIVKMYDNIDFELIDPRRIFFDPFVDDYENLDIIIEEVEKSWNYLLAKERAGIYHGIDKLKKDELGGEKEKNVETQNKMTYLDELVGTTKSFGTKKKYKLWEIWCLFDIDNDGIDKECIMVVAEGKYVIRLEENPFRIKRKPYIFHTWERIEGTMLGMGVPQVAEKMQIALNDFLNQIMDNITFILNNMWVVDELADVPDIQLKSRPRGIIRTKGNPRDTVVPLERPVIVNEGLSGVSLCKEDIRQATGATMSLQGMPARYGTTAEEYRTQFSSAAREIFSKLRSIEDDVIKKFLWIAYNYNLQFMSRDDFIRINGVKAIESLIAEKDTVESLEGDFDFICLGLSQTENRLAQTQQWINLYNIVVKSPPGIVKLDEVLKEIFQLLTAREPERFFYPSSEPMMIAPEDENTLFLQGEMRAPHPLEPHINHIAVHQKLGNNPVALQHIDLHIKLMQLVQMQQQGGQGLPPQEQPRIGPTAPTIAEIEKVEPKW